MKLVRFSTNGQSPRLGALQGDRIADLAASVAATLAARGVVRAHEIAQEGVKEAVANLHGDLNLTKNVRRFETGTYGELKSGQQRYSTGPQGIY